MSGGTRNTNPFINSHLGTESIHSLKWWFNFSVVNNFPNKTIFPPKGKSGNSCLFRPNKVLIKEGLSACPEVQSDANSFQTSEDYPG